MPDILFGEFKPDLSGLEIGSDFSFVLNAIPSGFGLRPTLGPVKQSAVLDEFCRGAVGIQYYDQSTQNFAGDKTKLYKVNTLAATDVSKAGGYDLTLSPGKFWEFVTYGEIVIACNIVELPQQFDQNDALFSDITQAPKAGLVTTIGLQEAFLVLGRLDEGGTQFPNKVAWNDPGDLTQWIPGEGFAGEQLLEGDGGPIRQILGGDFGVIFQERAIWTMEFTGLPEVFTFRQILLNHGLIGPHAAALHNDDIYYINLAGFYKLARRGGLPDPIGSGKVNAFFNREVDPDRLDEVVAIPDGESNVIFWSFASRQASPGVADRLLVYSPISQQWGFVAYESEFLFLGFSDTVLMDDVASDQDLDTGSFSGTSLDAPVFTDARRIFCGFDIDHTFTIFRGAPLRAFFTTGLIQLGDADKFKLLNKFRSLIQGAGRIQSTLGITNDPNKQIQVLPLRDVSKFGFFEYRTAIPRPRARYFSFGFTVDDGWDSVLGINIPAREIHEVGER